MFLCALPQKGSEVKNNYKVNYKIMLKLFLDRTNSPKLNSKDYTSQIHFVITTKNEINKANSLKNSLTKKKSSSKRSFRYRFCESNL